MGKLKVRVGGKKGRFPFLRWTFPKECEISPASFQILKSYEKLLLSYFVVLSPGLAKI